MCSANDFATTARLTFIVGVISPPASVKSTGRMRNSRICSARDTAWLASSTAWAISPVQLRSDDAEVALLALLDAFPPHEGDHEIYRGGNLAARLREWLGD